MIKWKCLVKKLNIQNYPPPTIAFWEMVQKGFINGQMKM